MSAKTKIASDAEFTAKLCARLELSATASEADILAAVSILKQQNANLRASGKAAAEEKRDADELDQAIQKRIRIARGGITYEQARTSELHQRMYDKHKGFALT